MHNHNGQFSDDKWKYQANAYLKQWEIGDFKSIELKFKICSDNEDKLPNIHGDKYHDLSRRFSSIDKAMPSFCLLHKWPLFGNENFVLAHDFWTKKSKKKNNVNM